MTNNRNSTIFKIVAPTLASVTLFAALFFGVMVPHVKDRLVNARKAVVREAVHMAVGIVAHFHQAAEEGRLSLPQAQAQATEYLRRLRYGSTHKEYFFVVTQDELMAMHPYRQDYEQKPLATFKDLSGKPLLKAMKEVVAHQQEGFIEYVWQWQDDSRRMTRKISFVKGFAPWRWIVGSGVYLEDIENDQQVLLGKLTLGALIILMTVSLLAGYMVYQALHLEQQRSEALTLVSENEAKYRAILESAPNPIVVYDKQGLLQYINPAFNNVFGWTLDEVHAHKVDFVPAESQEETRHAIDFIYRSRQGTYSFESKRRTRDGKLRDVIVNAAAYHDDKGEIVGMVANFEDITDKKQSEKELLASREKFDAIGLAARDTILMIDDDGLVAYCSEAGEALTGYSPQALQGCDYTLLLPDKIRHAYQEGLIGFRNSGQGEAVGKTQELAILTKSGDSVPVEVSVSSVSLRDRWHAIVIVRDITERIEAQRSIFESERKFRSLFASCPDGIILMGRDGFITEANAAFRNLLGFSTEELEGVHPFKITPEIYHRDEAEIVTALSKGISIEKPFEKELICKGGRRVPVTVQMWVVQQQSQVAAIGAFVKDLSFERQLATDKQFLEKQLHHAQRLEAIGTLAGGIAHDFNNILGGIIGYTELSQGLLDEKNSKVARYLERIQKAGDRAKDLVQQILYFSRQHEFEFEPIDLIPVIKEVIKLMRATLPKTIEIQAHIDVDQAVVLGDASQVHQIFLNLCTNAYHAMREKGGRLTVSVRQAQLEQVLRIRERELPPGTYVEVRVKDTGTGMTPEIMRRIFEPYFTTKKINEGTGLGLSVLLGLLQRMHGNIDVTSRPGVGSTFMVWLPVSEHPEKRIDIGDYKPPTGEESILVVDDEPFFLDVMHRYLVSLGYRVNPFSLSTEALDAFAESPENYDLIVTDQTMPELTGVQLAGKVHAIRPEIPILLCTGYSEHVTEETALRCGIAKFLMKPTTRRDLALAVREALG